MNGRLCDSTCVRFRSYLIWVFPRCASEAMDGSRCVVETLAELPAASRSCAKLMLTSGPDVIICDGSDEVIVFNVEDKKLTAVLRFPGAVADLVLSSDQTKIYAACADAVYFVNLPCHLSRLPGPAPQLVVGEEGVCCLLLLGSLLATLSRRGALWWLSLYAAPAWSPLLALALPPTGPGLRGDQRAGRGPVLAGVHAGEGSPHLLPPSLFARLFGADAALARAPALLAGLPDGRLLGLPLPPAGKGVPHGARVLAHLHQPVVLISASVATGTGGCLVALGARGGVVQLGAGPEEGEGAGLGKSSVGGPILCGWAEVGGRIYFSTGSQLLILGGRSLLPPITWDICGLVGLAGHAPGPGEDAAPLPSLLAPQVGRRISSVLAAIGDVCARATSLRSIVHHSNQLLRQLNEALHIACLLLANQEASQPRPISCRAVAAWHRLLRRDWLELSCVVENASPYALQQGWTLCVSVCPPRRPLPLPAATRNFSLPLQLPPGGRYEVSLPLGGTAGGLGFPMTVACCLVFSPADLGGSDPVLEGVEPVSLPLPTLTLDWLDSLRLAPPPDGDDIPTPDNGVRAFLRARGAGGAEPRLHSATVSVSSGLLGAVLPGGGALPSGLAAAVLGWLLGGAGPQGDQPLVHARCPGGGAVTLSARETHSKVLQACVQGRGSELPLVEIKVQSCSMEAVCGLRHAVLARIQALQQRAPGGPSPNVDAQAVRRAMQRAEALLQQLRQARGPEAFVVGVSGGLPQTQALLGVYQQVRDAPLALV